MVSASKTSTMPQMRAASGMFRPARPSGYDLPVPSFGMAKSDHAAQPEDLRVGVLEDVGAYLRMLLHDLPLL